MKILIQQINHLRPYWIGAIGGLLLSSAILGYQLHSQQRSYKENLGYAMQLSFYQNLLLEAELNSVEHLIGLEDEFGESHPGPISAQMDSLAADPNHVSLMLVSAASETLTEGIEKIPEDHDARRFYPRTLEQAMQLQQRYAERMQKGEQTLLLVDDQRRP